MHVSPKLMTAADIQKRLHELYELQRAHDARDMDAELAKVLRDGGDVDAIETAQLEAERMSRRYRVELLALEAELPLALERSGAARIGEMAEEFKSLIKIAKPAADDLVGTWDAFSRAVAAWEEIQANAVRISAAVQQVAAETKAKAPDLGNFRSAKVMLIADSTVSLRSRLALAEREIIGGARGVQSYVLD